MQGAKSDTITMDVVAVRVTAELMSEKLFFPLPSINDVSAMWTPSLEQWATSIETTLKSNAGSVFDQWISSRLTSSFKAPTTRSAYFVELADTDLDKLDKTWTKALPKILHVAKDTFSLTTLPRRPSLRPQRDRITNYRGEVDLPKFVEKVASTVKKADKKASEEVVDAISSFVEDAVSSGICIRNTLVCAASTSETEGDNMSTFTKKGKNSRVLELLPLFDRCRRDLGRVKAMEKEEKRKERVREGKEAPSEQKDVDVEIGMFLVSVALRLVRADG